MFIVRKTNSPLKRGAGGLKMKKAYLDYNLNLKLKARDLRNNSTLSEVLLWKKLRALQMMGYKFNRQKPIENYMVDFYCKALNLVIDLMEVVMILNMKKILLGKATWKGWD